MEQILTPEQLEEKIEEGFSVFLTGLNLYMLSDEISTKLTGRYFPFEVFPLDFSEYILRGKMKRLLIFLTTAARRIT